MQLSPLLQIRKQAQRAAAAYLRSHSYQVGAARSQTQEFCLIQDIGGPGRYPAPYLQAGALLWLLKRD